MDSLVPELRLVVELLLRWQELEWAAVLEVEFAVVLALGFAALEMDMLEVVSQPQLPAVGLVPALLEVVL
jgi:hypothetical protein